MRSFSNTYIFVFSLVMVTVVAVLLSFVSTQLKPRQLMNIQIERKQDVLRSVGQATEVAEADDKNTYIDEEFSRFISESYVVDFNGNQVDVDAFEVMLELNAEIRKPQEERNYPVFVYAKDGGEKNTWSPCAAKGSGVPSGDMWPWMMT
jgi:Na+-transporting NADH:ubiquinone oxidoreductase subunit C